MARQASPKKDHQGRDPCWSRRRWAGTGPRSWPPPAATTNQQHVRPRPPAAAAPPAAAKRNSPASTWKDPTDTPDYKVGIPYDWQRSTPKWQAYPYTYSTTGGRYNYNTPLTPGGTTHRLVAAYAGNFDSWRRLQPFFPSTTGTLALEHPRWPDSMVMRGAEPGGED